MDVPILHHYCNRSQPGYKSSDSGKDSGLGIRYGYKRTESGYTCKLESLGYYPHGNYPGYYRSFLLVFLVSENAEKMWDALLEAGKDEGLIPCGLGARDTLRMEAAMPLYGHEMDDEISPLETGLKFAVKMGKEEDFIGKKAMEERGEPKITRIGLKVTGRGIIREHQDIYIGEKKIGHTTSGTHCPFLGYPIAMALVDAGSVEIGNKVEVDVRGRKVEAEVIALPFYKRAK